MSNNYQPIIVNVFDFLIFVDSSNEKAAAEFADKIIGSIQTNEDILRFIEYWYNLYFNQYQMNKVGLLMVLSFIMVKRKDFQINKIIKASFLDSLYEVFNNSSTEDKAKIEELLDLWVSEDLYEEKEISLQKLKFAYPIRRIPYKEYSLDHINSIDKSSKDTYIKEITPLLNKLLKEKINSKEVIEVESCIKSLLDSYKSHLSILNQVDSLLETFKDMKASK